MYMIMREQRNKLYGHAQSAAMTDADFNQAWTEMEKVILHLERTVLEIVVYLIDTIGPKIIERKIREVIFIIKVGDDKDNLQKFVQAANKEVLLPLKENPSLIPEELFSFTVSCKTPQKRKKNTKKM